MVQRRKSKRLDFRLELEVTKEAHLLFKVINERYNRDKSLIFTTNVEEPDWVDYLGDPISTRRSKIGFSTTPSGWRSEDQATVSMKENCSSKNMHKKKKTIPVNNFGGKKSQNEIKNQYRNTQKNNPFNCPLDGDHKRVVSFFPVRW